MPFGSVAVVFHVEDTPWIYDLRSRIAGTLKADQWSDASVSIYKPAERDRVAMGQTPERLLTIRITRPRGRRFTADYFVDKLTQPKCRADIALIKTS